VNLKGEKKENVKKRAYLFSGKNRIANFPPSSPILQINPSRIPGREKKSSQIPGQKGRKRRFCLNFREDQGALSQIPGQCPKTATHCSPKKYLKCREQKGKQGVFISIPEIYRLHYAKRQNHGKVQLPLAAQVVRQDFVIL
jgi:hypothetical protein